MSSAPAEPGEDQLAQSAANTLWPDLYVLLGVSPDADPDTLRRSIRQAYQQAIANTDHRIIERRIHYQTLAERIIPQARRILLDPTLRARYNRESERHKAGLAAPDFATFLTTVSEAPSETLSDEVPGREGEFVRDLEMRDESAGAAPTSSQSPTNAAPPIAASSPDEGTATASEPPVEPTPQPRQADNAALYASVIRPEGPDASEHSSVALRPSVDAASAQARRAERGARVSLGESELSRRAVGGRARSQPVVSQRTQMLGIGLCAALLILYILRTTEKSAAPVVTPLRVAYASDMDGFMTAAAGKFMANPANKSVQVVPYMADSRDTMSAILAGHLPADIWLPAESLWSDRFNEVARSKHLAVIQGARSLALSPFVLVARSEQAAALHRAFPGGIVTSWQALHDLVGVHAINHFGLTDPTLSGSGALSRYFMAHDWCLQHHVAWNKSAAGNANLWSWLAGFDNNVPASETMSSDVAKALALGTADRYWWAISYESDAIHWIEAGKSIDVFYLPETDYADHPLCTIDATHAEAAASRARTNFENFLRTVPVQQLLLQQGFRPTEIELTAGVAGNPFTSALVAGRGIRKSGFVAQNRINYSVLNALNVAWAARYQSSGG